MTNVLIVDGKEFVPATLAGKHFGYTKDYLLMLIKGGKIDGQKIGHKWYVHIPSAEEHFRVAKEVREVRRKTISLERKAELKKSVHTKIAHGHHTALVETLAIVIIGLSLGVTGYVGSDIQRASVHEESAQQFLGELALSLYTAVTPAPEPTPALIVAPADTFTKESVADIQDSFSDPVTVTVDPENTDTGIITPVFKDGKDGSEYRFLLVPLDTGSGVQSAQDDSSNASGPVVSNGNVPVIQN